MRDRLYMNSPRPGRSWGDPNPNACLKRSVGELHSQTLTSLGNVRVLESFHQALMLRRNAEACPAFRPAARHFFASEGAKE